MIKKKCCREIGALTKSDFLKLGLGIAGLIFVLIFQIIIQEFLP
jgi:hypothetical protein